MPNPVPKTKTKKVRPRPKVKVFTRKRRWVWISKAFSPIVCILSHCFCCICRRRKGAIGPSKRKQPVKVDSKNLTNSKVMEIQGGDASRALSKCINLVDVPPELRWRIWNLLPANELQRLSQVCTLFRLDVDICLNYADKPKLCQNDPTEKSAVSSDDPSHKPNVATSDENAPSQRSSAASHENDPSQGPAVAPQENDPCQRPAVVTVEDDPNQRSAVGRHDARHIPGVATGDPCQLQDDTSDSDSDDQFQTSDAVKDKSAQQKDSRVELPRVFKTLTIGPNWISPQEVHALMAVNPVLDLLTFDFNLMQYSTGMHSEQIMLSLESIFTSSVSLTELRVNVSNWRNYLLQNENILPPEDWKFGRNGFKVTYPLRVQNLSVYAPGLSLRHLLKWRIFLNYQKELVSLICNLDSISWTLYKPAIGHNRETLKVLELYCLTNHNGGIQAIDLFDWTILNELTGLSRLRLWGDSRYYGLRAVNCEAWELRRLEELELKCVDLSLPDLQHLLYDAPRLRLAMFQLFTPIPDVGEMIPPDEFLYLCACVMSQRRIHQLIFLDHKLPAPFPYRKEYLENACHLYSYTPEWSPPDRKEFDYMEFKIKDLPY